MQFTSQPPEVPTPEIVDRYNEQFNTSDVGLSDRSLELLFSQFPGNVEPEHVLLKVMALNATYNTRVLDIHLVKVAIAICKTSIDEKLALGSPELVNDILFAFKSVGIKRYYSFVTKYCSWHQPEKYPIYDSYVDDLLWQYKNAYRFTAFRRYALADYIQFKSVIEAFRNIYALTGYSYKQLDKFLWGYGKEYYWTRNRP
ncbi:MAG: hypothetical protein IAE89_15970 [Anaerolineae bacterium]|nr:hypothetical protein [Anaerolineae bacterium]